MRITFWGTRGSLAVPGTDTLRYGGNTSCVCAEFENLTVALDAGTGVRGLGISLFGTSVPICVLATHAHTDHVQGFPFFKPLFEPGRTLHVVDTHAAGRRWSMVEMFDGVHVPLLPGKIEADVHRHAPGDLEFFRDYGLEIETIPLNHPGGSTGFLITDHGLRVAYITDNELDADDPVTTFDALADFCSGVEVLIHDAQYIEADMHAKGGWGHSPVERVCELAAKAGVGQLVLFHHDPGRTDEELARVEAGARDKLATVGINVTAAAEGQSIEM